MSVMAEKYSVALPSALIRSCRLSPEKARDRIRHEAGLGCFYFYPLSTTGIPINRRHVG